MIIIVIFILSVLLSLGLVASDSTALKLKLSFENRNSCHWATGWMIDEL
jgi:hypothetical protein